MTQRYFSYSIQMNLTVRLQKFIMSSFSFIFCCSYQIDGKFNLLIYLGHVYIHVHVFRDSCTYFPTLLFIERRKPLIGTSSHIQDYLTTTCLWKHKVRCTTYHRLRNVTLTYYLINKSFMLKIQYPNIPLHPVIKSVTNTY